ncbi:MAG: RNA polymerase sigma factor [Deltaproteobacteria bacterium]
MVEVCSDNELIDRHLCGDDEAFAAIITRYQAYVFAIILRFVSERQDAEDIAQEIFLQLYRSLPDKQPGDLKSWIGKIAVNKAIDWKRSQKRRQALADCLEQICLTDDSPCTKIEQVILQREQEMLLHQLCRGLSPPYRRVVVKYHFEGKSYQTIAREEGISLKTVESRLYRARKMMREQWEEGD